MKGKATPHSCGSKHISSYSTTTSTNDENNHLTPIRISPAISLRYHHPLRQWPGDTLRRNHIRVISPDGHLQLNVKRYAIPHWPNRLIYSCFRRPKGLRAFIYPEHLIAAGIDTPAPVAYIEERTAGIIGYTYFVSLHSELPGRLYELGNARMDRPEHISLARDLARFAARIHEARLTHLDFSPGNVLYETLPDGSHRFALVDINRMRFGEVDIKRGCANFARLWGQPQLFGIAG